MMDSGETTERRVRRRLEELNGLYWHGAAYLVVNAGLFALDMLTAGGVWFYWVLFGWGVGLLIHITGVVRPTFVKRWERRRYEALLREERARDL